MICEVYPIVEVDPDRRVCDSGGGAQSLYPVIEILGEKLCFGIEINKEHAKLSDIVPLTRSVSSKIVEVIHKRIEQEGHHIPCKKGCSACCNYLIPLSIPEVFRLKEEVGCLPAKDRRVIICSMIKSARRILNNKRFGTNLRDLSQTDIQITANRISRWYAGIELTCPFLFKDICSWYSRRPLACREHIVQDSARLCIGCWSDTQKIVQMPVSALEALGELAAELEQT